MRGNLELHNKIKPINISAFLCFVFLLTAPNACICVLPAALRVPALVPAGGLEIQARPGPPRHPGPVLKVEACPGVEDVTVCVILAAVDDGLFLEWGAETGWGVVEPSGCSGGHTDPQVTLD